MVEHFGIKIIDKGNGFRLTKDNFAHINTKPSLPYFESLARLNAYADNQGNKYSETWCEQYRELCLKNFDLNMMYFQQLAKTDFNEALTTFLSQYNRFAAIFDLNDFAGVEGFYLMVLDDYNQVYIGKTKDIKKRIVQHWIKTKPFDRTLFPMYAWETSVFSIDFFRPLDTTRIYIWKRKISDGIEANLVRSFPSHFCTNRIGGDISNALQAIATMNRRNH